MEWRGRQTGGHFVFLVQQMKNRYEGDTKEKRARNGVRAFHSLH